MLEVSNVDLHYGAAIALRQVSVTAPVGEVTCLLGRNGVGKTSLLRAITGAHPVTRGRIRWEGADITRLPTYVRAQRGIDLPQRTLPRARRARAHQLGRELRRQAQGDVLVAPVRGLRDEDDVDVGDVVELAPARLAHADDGESSLLGALDALRRDVQPRLERGTREVGE